MSLAYGFCLVAGYHYHRKVKAIKRKEHGYKAHSFFRVGKDRLEAWLSGKPLVDGLCWEAALERAYRWLQYQIAYFYPKTEIFR